MCAALLGCAAEPIAHMLGEREANQMVELLAENGIDAQKLTADNGRTVSYTIAVGGSRRLQAISLLNRYEMPRRADMGYTEVFKEGGLIPTAGEEKAKQLAALEGEIEKQLRLVNGILDVQVQLVQPEENALRTAQDVRSPVTASVTIKYLPASDHTKPLTEQQVQAVVAAGVERLTADNVVVVMTPTGTVAGRDTERPGNQARSVNDKNMKLALVLVVIVIGALLLALIGVFLRMQTVAGRFARLQAEIAKARRRPPAIEGMPPPPAS